MAWSMQVSGRGQPYTIERESIQDAAEELAGQIALPSRGLIFAKRGGESVELILDRGKILRGDQILTDYSPLADSPGESGHEAEIGGLSILLIAVGAIIFIGSIWLGSTMIPEGYRKPNGYLAIPVIIWAAGAIQALLFLALAQGLHYLKRIAEK